MIENHNSSILRNGLTKTIKWLDGVFDRLYRSKATISPMTNVHAMVWAALPQLQEIDQDNRAIEEFFLGYFQSQGYGPTRNECVTTCVLMSMNILTDLAAIRKGHTPPPQRKLRDYTAELDRRSWRGWIYRFSSSSLLPGMMTPWQGLITLKEFARQIKKRYSSSLIIKLSKGHTPHDLISMLKEGRLILLHGAWKVTLDEQEKRHPYHPLQAILGGMPHTMLLAGYDAVNDEWLFMNPASPWPANVNMDVNPSFFRMRTSGLLEFWGRRFIFYPPRFSATTLTMEK